MRRFLLLGIALLLAGCGKKQEAPVGRGDLMGYPVHFAFAVAVIPQGTAHEYWKSIHAGAVKASRDYAAQHVKVNIIWKGPMREDDREQQVQVVEGFVTQHVDGIVLAPFDKNALVRPVEEAKRAGIPTVVIDSALESNDPISFVASNNYHGGELAADEMGRLLNGKGRVLVLRYQEAVFMTEQRAERLVDTY